MNTVPLTQWFWQDDDKRTWKSYSKADSQILETVLSTGGSAVDLVGGRYQAILASRQQIQKRSGYKRKILRGTWFWQEDDHTFKPFLEDIAARLEGAFLAGQYGSRVPHGDGTRYSIINPDGTGRQHRNSGGKPGGRPIRRGFNGIMIERGPTIVQQTTMAPAPVIIQQTTTAPVGGPLVGLDTSGSNTKSKVVLFKEGYLDKSVTKKGQKRWKLYWVKCDTQFFVWFDKNRKEKGRLSMPEISSAALDSQTQNQVMFSVFNVKKPLRFRAALPADALEWVDLIVDIKEGKHLKKAPKKVKKVTTVTQQTVTTPAVQTIQQPVVQQQPPAPAQGALIDYMTGSPIQQRRVQQPVAYPPVQPQMITPPQQPQPNLLGSPVQMHVPPQQTQSPYGVAPNPAPTTNPFANYNTPPPQYNSPQQTVVPQYGSNPGQYGSNPGQYPPQQQQTGYPPQQPQYGSNGQYPPQQQGQYPPQQQQTGYPPQQPGQQQQYPPQQQTGYPPQQGQQQGQYPPQQQQTGYPPQQPGQQQQTGYPPQQPAQPGQQQGQGQGAYPSGYPPGFQG